MTEEQSKSFDRAFEHISALAPDHAPPAKKRKEASLTTDTKSACLAELRKVAKLSDKFEKELKEMEARSKNNPYTAAFQKDLTGKNKGPNRSCDFFGWGGCGVRGGGGGTTGTSMFWNCE